MRRGQLWRRSAALVSFLFAGCVAREPFLVLKVTDPNGVATGFAELLLGDAPDQLRRVKVERQVFPLAVTVIAAKVGERELWVEARDAGAAAVGRGRERVRFARRGTPTATVALARACATADACRDALFCNGVESCADGICVAGDVPCAANVECATSVCLEEGGGVGRCDITVDHLACGQGSYCNPVRGCVAGTGCLDDADCQDDFACNGEEACVNLVCTPGLPPVVSDGDICTLDGCDDARTDLGLAPVFNFPLVTLDGSACTIPGGGDGVCVASKDGCVASACGDGVVFALAGELCDSGPASSDTWALAPHCNGSCSDWAPTCGDGLLDEPFESCDDGDAKDDGNGCSADCQRYDVCGNQTVESLFEACDLNADDDCDGCLSDCSPGCVCLTGGGCTVGQWCDTGHCLPCDTTARCGPSCVACAGRLPECAGVELGCQCVDEPAPNGSCGVGARCVSGACSPCDTPAACGPSCAACTAPGAVCDLDLGCLTGVCTGLPDYTRCGVVTTPDRKYDICINEVCVSPGCGDLSCNVAGVSFPLGDSGERTCYDNSAALDCPPLSSCATAAFCGQDAQYGWDAQYAPGARFSAAEPAPGEPIVRDNATGLMWTRCPAGMTPGPPPWCGGAAQTLTYTQAVAYCDALDYGGYRDWHLPDPHELLSLQDVARPEGVDTTVLPDYTGGMWTSAMADTTQAWRLEFLAGGGMADVTTSLRVVCVRRTITRSGTLPRFASFYPDILDGGLVISDSVTGLMWQGCFAPPANERCSAAETYLSWEEALHHCAALSWAGFSDWRLASVVERRSLCTYRYGGPWVDVDGWLDPEGWTSTTSGTFVDPAWAMAAGGGNDTYLGALYDLDSKSESLPFVCVRGGY